MMLEKGVTRRDFIKMGVATATAVGLGGVVLAQPRGEVIRCGFIGVGGRGTGLLGETLNFADVVVPAICDINQNNLNRALNMVEKAKGKRPQGYSAGPFDYRHLLERNDLDAVVIATPCDLHAQMYLDAIAANKHLYGEKPMCLTVKEANQLVSAQEKKPHLVVQIGFQRRANPHYQEAIALIHQGEIGPPIEGRGAWDNAWGPLRGWFSRRERSGDWMLEQACHTWDVFNWVAQALPLRAFGVGRKDIYTADEPDRNVTDYYTAILEYPNGFSVMFHHSWFCPNDGAFTGVYERVAGLKGGCDLGAGRFIYRDGRQPRTVGRGVNDTRESLRSFFDAIKEGRKPVSGVYNGRDATLVGLLVRRAVDRKGVATMREILSQG